MAQEKIGNFVKELRKEQDLAQGQLAEQMMSYVESIAYTNKNGKQ